VGGATFDAFTYDGVTFPYFKTGETELGLNTWFSSSVHTVNSGVAQSSDGTYFVQYTTVAPYLLIQKLVSGVYRNLELPSTLPTGAVRSASFSPNGNFLAIAHSTSPYLTVYERSGDTFTKISDPATLPTGNGFSVAWDETSTYLAIAHLTTPFVTVYERSGSTLTKLSDPATLPTGSGGGVSWGNNSGVSLLAVSHETSPFVTIYSRSGSTLTKLTNPATLPTGGAGTQGAVSFSSDGAWLAVAHSVSPFVTVYSVTGGGSSITKISNPATLPTSTCTSADWSANTNYLALTCNATDVSVVYYRSGSTLTKLTDPTYLFEASTSTSVDKTAMFSNRDQNYLIVVSQYSSPQLYSYTSSALSNYNHSDDFTNLTTITSAGGSVSDIKQSINGGIVATANSLTPFMAVYSKTGSILDKLSDPATLPTGTGRGVGIHPSNKFIAVAHSVSPFVSIYSLYGRTLTKLSNPATLPTGIAHVAEFSNSGEFLAVGHEVSPFISVYQKSGTTFTKLTNPATLPTTTVTQVGWSHDDRYLIVGFNASPYVAVYEKSGTTLTKLSDPSTLPVSQNLSGTSQIITSPNDYKFVFQESVGSTNYGKTLIYSISGSTVSVEFDSTQNNILVGNDVNPIKYWGVDNVLGICNTNTGTTGPAQLMYFKYEGVSGFTPYKTTLLPTAIGCDPDSYFSLEGRTVISDDAGTSISIIENTNLPSGSPSVLHNYGYGMK
jgi:6-phosphogluconolactonase (cycloisomerase 2 family)